MRVKNITFEDYLSLCDDMPTCLYTEIKEGEKYTHYRASEDGEFEISINEHYGPKAKYLFEVVFREKKKTAFKRDSIDIDLIIIIAFLENYGNAFLKTITSMKNFEATELKKNVALKEREL